MIDDDFRLLVSSRDRDPNLSHDLYVVFPKKQKIIQRIFIYGIFGNSLCARLTSRRHTMNHRSVTVYLKLHTIIRCHTKVQLSAGLE
jgi:hypothetical protein